MISDQWQKTKDLLDAALKRPPDERLPFVDENFDGDEDVRREVVSLLAKAEDAADFLETPAVGEVADEIAGSGENFLIGQSLGHYKITKLLGRGGMGEVYLADDKKLDRRVAVKILNEKFAEHESNLARFTREAKAVSALNHPNILVIYEIGESENIHYIVSEFIEGETLREYLVKSTMKTAEILDIAIQISGALLAAHTAKIVHRDIKPENIIVRPDGFVKILDFGIAKLVEPKSHGFEASTVKQNETAKGLILGTINYMSPEQAKGEKIDERTDIFSFGAVIYEMIAGRTPFAGDSMSETFANLIKQEPPPLARFAENVPDELNRIVGKTLCKNKNERYQMMRDLLTDLKSLRENLAFDARLEKSHLPDDKNATAILPAATGETEKFAAQTEINFTGKIKRRKPLAALALITLLITAIGLGFYFLSAGKTASDGKKSLAVLPFVNAGRDPNTEYLSDGISESIINNLSQLSGLRVMSRNSAFRFKNNQTDTKNIASQLGVENLVTGDITQSGDKLIINVRLINAADDSQIWGNQYVKSSGDLIAAQNEIAQAVANNLRIKLTETEQNRLGKNYTANAEAYQLYMKGRFFLLKAIKSETEKSISYFRQAIELDPNYALAYAGLSDAYRGLTVGGEMPSGEMMPKAEAAAQTAIELDDRLAEAHANLAHVYFWYNWDWNAAEKEYQRALELDPNSTDALQTYAHLLTASGRHTEALAKIKRARELDPLDLRVNSIEGMLLYYAGQMDEAIARLQKTLELDPNYRLPNMFAARAYIEKGMLAEAINATDKAREISPESSEPISYGTYALAKSGRRAEAKAALDGLLKSSATRYVPPYSIALIYNALGETEKALDYLEKGFAEKDVRMVWLKVEPKWNNLRNEPRFADLIRLMNFESIAGNAPPTTKQELYWQMSETGQLALIQKQAQHIQNLIGEEPTKFDEEALRAIKVEIDFYVKKKDSLSQEQFEEGLRVIYGRASQYAPIVIQAYEARRVPVALGLYQAMVESEYHDCPIHPHPKGPVGLFQFSRKTAAKYGLTPKDYCNIEKQSDAAAHYMSDLSSDFGDGKSSATLGLLGFMISEDKVRDYLRQLRGRGVTERNFWTIFRHRQDLQPPLSDHGKGYVPRFFAAAIIGETPEAFELSTPPLTTLHGRGK